MILKVGCTRGGVPDTCQERPISVLPMVFRWQFTCTDLWRTCVLSSTSLQTQQANSPGLVHRIDLFPLAQKPGMFYVDEIIIADRNLTGDLSTHSPSKTCSSKYQPQTCLLICCCSSMALDIESRCSCYVYICLLCLSC